MRARIHPPAAAENAEPLAASLSRFKNSVKVRSSGDLAWKDVRQNMPLYNRDAVQTASDSSAVISFDAANTLQMASNSLIIVKSLSNDQARNERKSALLLVYGELLGKLAAPR
jgi:hypothetical protein